MFPLENLRLLKQDKELEKHKCVKDYFQEGADNVVSFVLVDVVRICVFSLQPIWLPFNGLKKMMVKDLK